MLLPPLYPIPVMISCRLFGHWWRIEHRATDEGICYASTFKARICARCQLTQVKANGPLGDRKWHPISPFPGNPDSTWEADRFARATPENYFKLYGR